MEKQDLVMKLYFQPLYTELARAIDYTGFPFRELYARMKPLIDRYGFQRVAAAIAETVSCTGWRVTLNPRARKCCLFLGPPPERWDEHYRYPDGSPMPRPPGREKPPEIPPPVDDPYLNEISRLPVDALVERLADARRKAKQKAPFKEDVAALESELLRRGIEPPPEVKREPSAKPKRIRKKK